LKIKWEILFQDFLEFLYKNLLILGFAIGVIIIINFLISVYNCIVSFFSYPKLNPPDLVGLHASRYTWEEKWFGAHPSIPGYISGSQQSFKMWQDRLSVVCGKIKLLKNNINNDTY
jgi:hypothetical protein